MVKPNKKGDRPALLAFAEALDTRPVLVKPDEYNDWRLVGSRGHVYATPESGDFWIYVVSKGEGGEPSAKAWSYAKKLFKCPVSQDGDDEGIFRLSRLPTAEEAKVIRRLVGLPQRRFVSPDQLDRLRSMAFKRSQPTRSEG